MKIGLVLHQLPPRHNTGTELFALRVAKSLVERGHQVSVFAAEPCFDDTARFEEEERVLDGIRCHVVLASSALHANAALAEYDSALHSALFAEWLLRERPDIVHAFHTQYVGAGIVKVCAGLGIPCCVAFLDFWALCPRLTLVEHGVGDCPGPKTVLRCARCLEPHPAFAFSSALIAQGRADEAFAPAPLDLAADKGDGADDAAWHAVRARPSHLRAAFHAAAGRVFTSRSLAERYVEAGFDADGMTIVPLGARDELVRRGPASLREPRSGRIEIAYLGGYVKHKGIEMLVDAFRALDWPAARLSICGNPDVDPELAERVHAKAGADRRIVRAGVVPPNELGDFLARMDLVVVPSLWTENTPFVVLEAQAAGLPVIVPRTKGFLEVAREGLGALCVEQGDKEELRSALARVRDEPELLARLAREVPEPRRHAGHVDALLALWERALASRAPGALPVPDAGAELVRRAAGAQRRFAETVVRAEDQAREHELEAHEHARRHNELGKALRENAALHRRASEALNENRRLHNTTEEALHEVARLRREAPAIHALADEALRETARLHVVAEKALKENARLHALADRALRENAKLHTTAGDALETTTKLHSVTERALIEADRQRVRAENAERKSFVFRPLRFLGKHWPFSRRAPVHGSPQDGPAQASNGSLGDTRETP